MGASAEPWVQVLTPPLTGWVTLSKSGLNLLMCKTVVHVWAGARVGPVVPGGFQLQPQLAWIPLTSVSG